MFAVNVKVVVDDAFECEGAVCAWVEPSKVREK